MDRLTDKLARYAEYHRDSRNVATHCVGIPMIVVAVAALLSRPTFDLGGVTLWPAILAALASALYYLRIDVRTGLLMTALLVPTLWAGRVLALLDDPRWLAASLGLFVVGWGFQFVGHWFEGRKPAFADDIMSLMIGPLFVVAEGLFALGLLGEVREAVHRQAHAGRPSGA